MLTRLKIGEEKNYHMKLLYLTHTVTWKGGGIFFTAYHLGRYLAARGHEVTLMTISPKARWGISERIIDGIRFVEMPDLFWGKARTGWDPWDLLWRIGFLQKGTFDLVHGFESRPLVSIPALYAKRKWKIPLVFTWADWFGRGGKGSERGKLIGKLSDPIETFCEDYFYKFGDACLAMGAPLALRAAGLGIPVARIFNILHGCDTEKMEVKSIALARASLGKFSNDVVLGYLGVMRPSSATLMFSAFREIKSRVTMPCKLVIIGNHKLDLKKYIPDDCKDDVIETGWLPYEDVNNYLAACDLLLLPLIKATATDNVWPSKCNDYLSIGRPIVATRMQSLVPIFDKFRVGILTEDHPHDFAEGCIKLINDSHLREEMGTNARAVAENELSWPIIGKQVEEIYNGCMKGWRM